MQTLRRLALALLMAIVALPACAYTIYLKDGTRFIAREKYKIEAGKAIILLQSGTTTSIAATEIDYARTEKANQTNLGTALVLDNGEFTDTPTGTTQRHTRLSDIARRESMRDRTQARAKSTVAPARTPVSAADSAKSWNPDRAPYRDLEIAEQIVAVFQARGVETVQILQGTSQDRALLDITSNSEGSIFRGLEAAAAALVEITEAHPDTIAAFEVLMMTAKRDRAGRFVLAPEQAAEIATGQVEPSAFFVQHVRF